MMDKQELELKAMPIITQLEGGACVNKLSEEDRRLALAYRLWSDGMDIGPDDIAEILNVNDDYWTSNQVLVFLGRMFGYNAILPGVFGA